MTASSRKKLQTIPDYLIYEMDEGKPIYYRGYKEVLKGDKTQEEVMGSSILQSYLVTKLIVILSLKLDRRFILISNEMGLLFKKKSWRSIDIAIYSRKKLRTLDVKLDEQYSKIPPKIVIEVDTKAHFDNASDADYYFQHKTDQLLSFGVERVIWIYTRTEKFMIAEKDKRWETANWTEDLDIMEGIVVNIPQLIEEFYQEEK